jgi:3-oxoacyl-[acyl-carrier protein] reductase
VIWKSHPGFAQPFGGYSQALPDLMPIVALAGTKGIISRSCGVNYGVITGGGGGLGKALVDAFDSSDWEIAAPDRTTLDLSNSNAIRSWFHARPVDLLVYAAGVTRDGPIIRMGEADWDGVFAVNYQGAADAAAAILPGMISRGKGHIVFISSYSAIHPPSGQAAYAAAKAALLGLTASLAHQQGSHGVRVNAVLPGFLETRMTQAVSARRKNEVLADHVLGRFNTPQAVAKFIRFLHDHLPDTSGQIFQLDSRVP